MSAFSGEGGRLGPLIYLTRNWISLLGVVLVTTGAVGWLFTLPLQFSAGASPYLALLTVVGLPLVFFVGLALIPLGIRIRRRRETRAGTLPKSFPAPTWQNPAFRNLLTFFMVATGLNVLIAGHMTYSAVEWMDSAEFCGTSCHIMAPEWTAYQISPHANVPCAECHIGESAGSFLAAKLNGTKQLAQVLTGTETIPVPTPVHNLAQGELTCEKCHSDQDLGSARKEWISFASDASNTATRTALRLFVGGGENPRGAHGAHMANGAFVEYASDPSRTSIAWMKYRSPSGDEREYATTAWSAGAANGFETRRMDCVDCHNRAAHSFEAASKAVDNAMAAGRIDPSLPFIKREAIAVLEAGYETRESATEWIPEALRGFYAREDADVARRKAETLDAAVEEILAIYERNIFPKWRVDWGTHPNQAGHEDYPGCFRCHNDDLVRLYDAQTPLGDDCQACHAIEMDQQPIAAPADQTFTLTSGSGPAATWDYVTPLAPVEFDHRQHIDYAQGDCTQCHNSLFSMGRGNLRYGGFDRHTQAEEAKASCAGCHVEGGTAFPALENCQECHQGLPAPGVPLAASAASGPGVGEVRYQTALGEVVFDHERHESLARNDCSACHTGLFGFGGDSLNYGGADLHKDAEENKASCADANCHVAGGRAFAAQDNCARCHLGLGERTPPPPPDERDRLFAELDYDTKLGEAQFTHENHVSYAGQDCTVCHVSLFALEKGDLQYGGTDLHRTAEANQTSCAGAGCHIAGGIAFAADGNCLKCHTGLARLAEPGAQIPKEAVYANALGDVMFAHDEHTLAARGDCLTCHDGVFPMAKQDLGYADDYHRTAEANGSSCAACHAPEKQAFESLQNCTRCHADLELEEVEVPPQLLRDSEAGFGSFALLVLLLVFPSLGLAQPAPDKGSGFVGRQRCAVCHQDTERQFDGSAHAHSAERMAGSSALLSCETCHGPGLAHVLALDPQEIVDFRAEQASTVNQACLSCHSGDAHQAQRFAGGHARYDVDCVACHQVHGEPAAGHLTASTNALCESCHTAVSASFNRPYGHRLSETGVRCVDCHEPHGTANQGNLRAFAANETVCLKCHADKRGPFPFEHAPVRMEPCSSCHEPHGSVNPRLMVRHNVGQLCLECHTSDLATLGASPPAFHDLRSARFNSCTSCHTKTHGSFVSRDFLR